MHGLTTQLRFCALVLILGVIATPVRSGDSEDKTKSLTAMSWNVRYDNPRDGVNAWKHRKDWVAEILKTRKVDVVGLQEVLIHQLNDLKRRLPEMSAYGVGKLNEMPLAENPYADWSCYLSTADRTQYVILSITKSLYSCVMYGKGITDDGGYLDRALSVMRSLI